MVLYKNRKKKQKLESSILAFAFFCASQEAPISNLRLTTTQKYSSRTSH